MEVEQHVWAYKESWFRDDDAAMGAAWQAFALTLGTVPHRVFAAEIVGFAAAVDDLDRATRMLLDWHPRLDFSDPDEDHDSRADIRTFVVLCAQVRARERSIGHRHEAALDAALRDCLRRGREWLTAGLRDQVRAGDELRAVHATKAAFAAAGTTAVVTAGLPPLRPGRDPMLGEARAALAALERDDDTTALDALLRRSRGTAPSLWHLLRSRRSAAAGDLPAALRDLDTAAAATDRLAGGLRPLVHATAGTLLAVNDPRALSAGIDRCRTGRGGRHGGTADAALARLLLWRALHPDTPPARRTADVREAVRLARRRCRPWRRATVEERVVLHDALAARAAVTGTGGDQRQARAWRRAASRPGTVTEQARLVTAWAAWAVGTGDAHLAAEAYRQLVRLVPLDAAARTGPGARLRVLAAAQEHTEEAGYWLTRTRRYKEAVVALETGRAIGLSEADGRHATVGATADVRYEDIVAATGDGALVYIAAAKAGGYALIVAARHDPQLVELRRLDRATIAGLVGVLLPEAHADVRGGPDVRDLALPRPAPPDPLAAALRTLWDSGLHDLVLHSVRGRVVTYVPVGLLSLLPLHAAGEPGTPGDRFTEWRHAGNFSAVRYTPNARELRRCQDTAAWAGGGPLRLLAVDVPDAPGPAAHLAHVARETTAVARRWTGAVTVLHDCTWDEFRAVADEHTVWHIACHGSARPQSILDSRLSFADREVTLDELRGVLRPGRRRLAVLSACESNLTGVALPNEVVGLPSALLRAGFAGVVASSWKVDDLATAYLMTAFYEQWCRAGHEPAVALAVAQQWLRTATHDDLLAMLPGVEPGGGEGPYPYVAPRYWAAFAYTGT